MQDKVNQLMSAGALAHDTAQLDAIIEGLGDGLLLNHPAERERLMSVGYALKRALRSTQIKSFSAIVGYFHHHALQPGERLDDDPASLLLEQLTSDGAHYPVVDEPSFNLLAGLLCSQAATMAVRMWYWHCRWRARDPERADAHRDRFIERVKALEQRSAKVSFVEAALELIDPHASAYADVPGPVQLGEGFTELLMTKSAETPQLLKDYWESTRYTLKLHDGPPQPGRSTVPRFEDQGDKNLKAVATLYGFFLFTGARVKLAPRRTLIESEEHTTATVATFHPKLYVIEQASEQARTISLIGSNNWSSLALGSKWTKDEGILGNVELSTIHASRGHGWSASSEAPESLGERASKVGRALFEQTGEIAGQWFTPGQEVDVTRLFEVLAVYTKPLLRVPDEELIAERPIEDLEQAQVELPPSQEEILTALTPALLKIIEQLLGLESDTPLDMLAELAQDPTLGFYGGKLPARYQIDGALRLVAMLNERDMHRRGAFLTDEAGIGKTLTALMTMTQLITARLIARFNANPGQPSPLKVSILAPARLVGKDRSEESTGWLASKGELVDAVSKLLNRYAQAQQMVQGAGPRLSTKAAHQLVQKTLEVRVLSMGGLSRELAQAPMASKQGQAVELKPSSKSSDPVGDLFYLACSELVLIDESHNLRNQTSRNARALHFALTLPCPGEAWPLWLEANDPYEPQAEQTARRRVLCLSATPFNNKIDDLTTQLAHFSQIQDWSPILKNKGGQQALELGGELVTALKTWRAASSSALKEPTELRGCFEVLLRQVYGHLRSQRALYISPDVSLDRELEEKANRNYIADGGPDYRWPVEYEQLKQQLATIYRWIKQRQEQEPERDDELEARLRLDAMLCDLCVQRSRSRALRLTAATQSADIDKMFRKPRVPRHPLALNQQANASSVEADILSQLYELLSGDEQRQAPLELFAYRLGVLRGRGDEGDPGAQAEQAIQNNLGFQRVGLVKRLQSSPYAFMRTLLRGLLRRTLYEIALVERLVAPWRDGTPAKPDVDAASAQRLGALAQRFEELLKPLGRWRSRFGALAEILGGVEASLSSTALCGELAGFYSPTGASLEPQAIERFEGDYKALLSALEPGAQARPTWVELLLADLERPDPGSKLIEDLKTIMTWAFEQLLVPSLYEGLNEYIQYQGRSLFARSMASLREGFLAQERYEERITQWLNARLSDDPRLGATLSWLIIQQHLSQALASEAPHKALPCGRRTLIFTEYTDTQDYVLAALAALAHSYRHEPSARRQLTTLEEHIAREARQVLEHLSAQSAQVRASEARSREFEYRRFQAPVDLQSEEVAAILAQLDDPQRRHEIIEAASLSLVERTARVCSGSASRPLSRGEAAPSASSALFEDGDEADEAEVSIKDGDVIEAFSPWYQISPPAQPGARATELRARLAQAKASPVDVLLATEVLSEGVNLQECGLILHYDLPWNPTRLIQRNGRIDRRLSSAYESTKERAKLIRELSEGERDWAPAFIPPAQVYHLTLLPAEPADHSLTTRVRERLFEKLDTIRAIFGLSSWPVVLSQEVAQQVLCGELEHETPGFRRREELFRQWNVLRALERQRQDALEPEEWFEQDMTRPYSVHLSLPGALRSVFARACGVREDQDQPGAGWEQVRAAGIVLWSPTVSKPKPARSAPEMSALVDDAQAGAITGALLVHDERASEVKRYKMTSWAIEMSARQLSLSPVLLGMRHQLGDAAHQRKYQVEGTSIDRLDAVEADFTPLLGPPQSPTALAEELTATLIEVLLDEDHKLVLQLPQRSEGYAPLSEASLEGYEPQLEQQAPWHVYLSRPLQIGEISRGAPLDKTDDKPSKRAVTSAQDALPNLWLTFND